MLKISEIRIDGKVGGCVTDRKPRVSFSLESDRPGEALHRAVITVGNWKKETTDQINNWVECELQPFTVYTVRVEATGTSGETAKAEASFSTGRLGTPWRAKWITDRSLRFPKKTSPVPMTFRRAFAVDRPVRRAWVNATAFGIYELMLNGRKVGNDYFAPGFTSYAHQMQYQTYDLTDRLGRNNTLTAIVAGGWAVGTFTYRRKNRISADRPLFLCEIYLEYADGTRDVIGTDETWEVTLEGNYRMADWYDGETYDATVDLDAVHWKPADAANPRHKPVLLAQYGDPVRVREILRPVSVRQAPSGEWIYDFGQNFAGVISARLRGRRGQRVVFRHAEVLVDGELFVKPLRTAKATATYICRDGEQEYSPRLTYMGFRYVGVRGIEPEDLELAAFALHSDFEEIGRFSCSNALINRLHENIRWSGKSNFVDIPTDCPQRDERMGWTGDIAVFARTACFLFDLGRFFDKWLTDMRAEQGRGGGIPMVVPRGGDVWPVMATSVWGDSCVLVPWAEYLARGNIELLRRQYPTIRKFLKAAKWWAGFLSFTPHGRYIWRWPFHFGDWCAPGENIRQWLKKGKWIATCYFAHSCGIAAEIAEMLGYGKDAARFRRWREKTIRAYRRVFTDGKGKLKNEFQTGYALPLVFGMTEGEETKAMADNLARLVREAGNRLATGFPGTPHLLFALSDFGHADTAYDLLLQEECPSWLYTVKAGGTTIWERWDALRPDGTVNLGHLKEDGSDAGMVSFNHYAHGSVGDWLYRRLAGIEPTSGGYRTFRVAPVVGGGITHAAAGVKTPYGRAETEWRLRDRLFEIRVTVPVSTTCTLVLPNGEQHELASGRHEFACEMPAGGANGSRRAPSAVRPD